MNRAARRWGRLAWTYLAALLLVWSLGEWPAEGTVPTLLLAYAPSALALLPLPALLLLSLWLRPARLPSLLALLVAVPYAGFTWHAAQAQQPSEWRLLIYNVARGTQGRPGALAAQIMAARPDFINLQETNGVSPGFTPQLLAKLPGYQVARAQRGGELLTLSRFTLLSARDVPLPGTSRRLLLTRWKTPQGEVQVINVHLSTVLVSGALRGRASSTRDKRATQLRILRAQVAGLSGPLIVAGDLNTPPRGHVYRALTQDGIDAWDATGRGVGWTYPASRPVLRIDHVLTRGLRPLGVEVLPAGGSDHRAVLVRLQPPP